MNVGGGCKVGEEDGESRVCDCREPDCAGDFAGYFVQRELPDNFLIAEGLAANRQGVRAFDSCAGWQVREVGGPERPRGRGVCVLEEVQVFPHRRALRFVQKSIRICQV